MTLSRPLDRALAMGYAGNTLLRAAETRDDDVLARALDLPGARCFLAWGSQWLCKGEPEGPLTVDFPLQSALELGADPVEGMLLGWTAVGREPRLAFALKPAEDPPQGFRAVDLRSLGMRHLLDADTEGQLAQAQHFLNWHARALFCGRCGGPTLPETGGYRRRCTACGEMHFPRTDPVAIMLVHDGHGNCILGRQPQFAPGMWSCLAGFVEPGETIEDAVRRETLEEAGIDVGDVAYHASQPWPFPGSLMIGCLGQALSDEIVIGDAELEACRWFTREEARSMLARAHPDGLTAPAPFAIAHHLLRAFCDA